MRVLITLSLALALGGCMSDQVSQVGMASADTTPLSGYCVDTGNCTSNQRGVPTPDVSARYMRIYPQDGADGN